MVIYIAGVVAAVIALRAVKKQQLSKINLYVALAGLVINLAACAVACMKLFGS